MTKRRPHEGQMRRGPRSSPLRRSWTRRGIASKVQVAHAGVSRSWLYSQPGLPADIERLREATQRAPTAAVPAAQRTSDASMLRRLQAAQARNRQLSEDNQRLRRQLAHALGDQRAEQLGTASNNGRLRHSSATIGPC